MKKNRPIVIRIEVTEEMRRAFGARTGESPSTSAIKLSIKACINALIEEVQFEYGNGSYDKPDPARLTELESE